MHQKTVQVIGLGYIGLPTAAVMADSGFHVLGFDISKEVVKTLNSGSVHIYEHGLESLVEKGVSSGRLHASVEIRPADVHIIAVPTPVNPDKSSDLSYVISACIKLCQVIKPGDIVIIESTIPPRTCQDIVSKTILDNSGLSDKSDYYLAHCPERVIPGRILHEIVYNDRIIGGTRKDATDMASNIYKSFVKGSILNTDATTAELCKVMENTFRDVNIALANQFSDICEKLEVNVTEAIALANHHPRVNIHSPGIGVGGHCIPVDPWFLIEAAPESSNLLLDARNINDSRPEHTASRIFEKIKDGGLSNCAILGLSFKADTDDFRESPSIEIVRILSGLASDKMIFIHDPYINESPKSLSSLSNVKFINKREIIELAEIIAVLVEHSEYSSGLPIEKTIRLPYFK